MARIKGFRMPVKNSAAAGCAVLAHPGLPCVHSKTTQFVKKPGEIPQCFHGLIVGEGLRSSRISSMRVRTASFHSGCVRI